MAENGDLSYPLFLPSFDPWLSKSSRVIDVNPKVESEVMNGTKFFFQNTEIFTFRADWKGCPKFSTVFSEKDPVPLNFHPKFSKFPLDVKRPWPTVGPPWEVQPSTLRCTAKHRFQGLPTHLPLIFTPCPQDNGLLVQCLKTLTVLVQYDTIHYDRNSFCISFTLWNLVSCVFCRLILWI